MSMDVLDPFDVSGQRADEENMLRDIAGGQERSIIRAAEISAGSFDKATQIQNEQFEKVFAIIAPEIAMRQEVMRDIQGELQGEFQETEAGKLETKMFERGLAKRGLQRSDVAIEGIKDLAGREADRNLQRKYTFAGLTGGTQAMGIQSLTDLGNTLSSFAIGSGQAQAQAVQAAASARGQGMMNVYNRRQQAQSDQAAAGWGIAAAFI